MKSRMHFVGNVEEKVSAKSIVSRRTNAKNVVEKESATMAEYDGNVLNVVAQACVHTAGEKPVASYVVA